MIDEQEVVQYCLLRRLEGIRFSQDRIISTTDLHKLHPVTVPMALTRGKLIRTSARASNVDKAG
eukprot:361445-Chlamydomonas_euryale.AAC.3